MDLNMWRKSSRSGTTQYPSCVQVALVETQRPDVRRVPEPLDAIVRLGLLEARRVDVDDDHPASRLGDPDHLGEHGPRIEEVVE